MDLIHLPQELLAHVLGLLGPEDIVNFGGTCKDAQSVIHPGNQILWRSAFLMMFDDPNIAWSQYTTIARESNKERQVNWDWHYELKRRLLAIQAIGSNWTAGFVDIAPDPEDVIETILDIIDTAKPRPTQADLARGNRHEIDDRSSLNIQALPSYSYSPRLENLIHDSHQKGLETESDHVPGRPTTRSMTKKTGPRSEAASRLHVLHGLTRRDTHEMYSKGISRQLVYDWTLTDERNEYGPFKSDGSGEIDWPRLEAACVVITRQFVHAADGRLAMPLGFCYAFPYRTVANPAEPRDWAGATGTQCGTYSFLDYADLFHFNTWNDPSTRPSLENAPEACGDLAKLELKLDDSIRDHPKLKTSLPYCDDLPPLFFSGISRSYDAWATLTLPISIKGMVCLVPGGKAVRWRYIVSYRGEEQWQLEGVQPGGIRSGCIYGLWTQCGHEAGGPVGTFCYAPEELCKTTAIVLQR